MKNIWTQVKKRKKHVTRPKTIDDRDEIRASLLMILESLKKQMDSEKLIRLMREYRI